MIDVHSILGSQKDGTPVKVRDPRTGDTGTIYLRRATGNVRFHAALEAELLPTKDERALKVPRESITKDIALGSLLLHQMQTIPGNMQAAAARKCAPGLLLVGWDPKDFNGLPCKDQAGELLEENARLVLAVDWIWDQISDWCFQDDKEEAEATEAAGKKSDTSSSGSEDGEQASKDSDVAKPKPEKRPRGKKQ